MQSIILKRTIDAPIDLVFETVADIRNYSKAVPHITEVKILSDIQSGVGTRFRETRVMKGRQATTEIEVTEYTSNQCIRCVSDTHGTVWDSLFEVAPFDGKTQLTLTMDATAKKFLAKLINPLIRSMIVNGVAEDMDAVKVYCEAKAGAR